MVVRGLAFLNEMESRERQPHVESWLDRFDPCGLWLNRGFGGCVTNTPY